MLIFQKTHRSAISCFGGLVTCYDVQLDVERCIRQMNLCGICVLPTRIFIVLLEPVLDSIGAWALQALYRGSIRDTGKYGENKLGSESHFYPKLKKRERPKAPQEYQDPRGSSRCQLSLSENPKSLHCWKFLGLPTGSDKFQ